MSRQATRLALCGGRSSWVCPVISRQRTEYRRRSTCSIKPRRTSARHQERNGGRRNNVKIPHLGTRRRFDGLVRTYPEPRQDRKPLSTKPPGIFLGIGSAAMVLITILTAA